MQKSKEEYNVNIFSQYTTYIPFIRSYESLSVRNMGDSGEQLARLQGYYKVVGHRAQFLRVEGNTATLKDTHETFVLSTTISYGEFGKD